MIRRLPAGVISEATFRRGYADAEAGYGIADCPYVETMNGAAWLDWRAGWRLFRGERRAASRQQEAAHVAWRSFMELYEALATNNAKTFDKARLYQEDSADIAY